MNMTRNKDTTLSYRAGPDGELLRCDHMPSSMYRDELCSIPENYGWKQHSKSPILKQDGVISLFKDPIHCINNNNNNNNNSPCSKTCRGKLCDGHVTAGQAAHMNTNGIDRKKMTGSSPTTSENLSWLSDVVPSQAQSQRPGLLAHEQSHGLSGSSGSIFRTPSLTDTPTQRLFSPGHIAPVYTSASSLDPYTPGMHSQSSHLATLSPYSAFYPQYSHAAYAPGSLLSGHYPHIESYSTMLAAMGSHVQHAQTQLPRAPYLGPLTQYHGTLTSTNSPGPHMHRQLGSTAGSRPLSSSHISDHHRRDRDMKSPKTEKETESTMRRHSSRTISPSSGQCLSSSTQVSAMKSGHHKDSSMREASSKDSMCMRPPASVGREGSMKHRILQTRPPDIHIEGEHRHQGVKFEEPPVKRHKSTHGHPPPLHQSSSSSSSSSSHPSSSLPPPPPLNPVAAYPNTPHYPPHFMKGSIIQLANGELKRVEDLRTDDFVNSAEVSSDLKIDSSTVVRIEEMADRSTALLSFSVGEHRVQVTVEATLEHPFFVFGQGWSSCQPQRTQQRYGLTCHKLSVGDVCISLTHKDANSKAAELSRQQLLEQTKSFGKAHNGASKSQVLRQQSTDTTRDRSSQHEAGQIVKRRWSAPDQISLETAKKVSTPQPEGSQQQPQQQPSPATSTKSDSLIGQPSAAVRRTTPTVESDPSPMPSSRQSLGSQPAGEKT